MYDLIRICTKVVGVETNSINATELHLFIQSKQQFADWIKNRIEQYSFVENEDYIKVLVPTKGRPKTEYYITLDMAKELAMVENNEKGREARRYFIEVEKEYKNGTEDYQKIILTQNTTIALLQRELEAKPKQIEHKPTTHPVSRLTPPDHNNMLDSVHQMIQQIKELDSFMEMLKTRKSKMQNAVNSFATRYPEIKEYLQQQA